MYEAEHKFAAEALALQRSELMRHLAEVEGELHKHMRAMRDGGATQVEIMAASGYRSIDAVRKILDPQVRAGAAAARKRRLQSHEWSAARIMPPMGLGESGGCGKVRLDHAGPPYGPYCQLGAGHDGECVYPPYPINHPHDDRGQCVTDGSVA